MFVWLFHRISGVLLLALIAVQLFSGFYQASLSNADSVKAFASLHKHLVLNFVMVFLFIFHSLYGVRTILLDLGYRREKFLFWACSVAGLILFTAFVVLFLSFVRQ